MRWLILFASSSLFAWTHIGSNIYGWNRKEITFGVNPTNCPVDETTLNRIIDASLSAWNAVPSSTVRLSRGTSTTTAAELIAYSATDTPVIACDTAFDLGDVDVIPGVMPGARVGSDGYITYAGVVLNAVTGAGANIANLSEGEVSVTLAHEIGHVLGLGHSGDSKALMYFQILQPSAIVTDDDVAGVTQLYPRNEMQAGAYGCAAAKNDRGRSTSWELFVFLILLVATPLCAIWIARIKLGRLRSPEELPPSGESRRPS